jgi:hypothetical protein
MAIKARRKQSTTDRYRRSPNFPEDWRLERFLRSNDPEIGYFKLKMKRRNARDLRRVLFGPKGLLEVPDGYGGVMTFRLPNGWTLRLTYLEFDEDARGYVASDVDAEFIPPTSREEPAGREEEAECYAEEASR